MALTQPWRSARADTTQRTGWLVRIDAGDGAHGWGETSVMPEAGTEDEDAAGAALTAACARLPGLDLDAARAALPGYDRPAARCGLDGALLDLEARRAGVPLHVLLQRGSVAHVAVNASCGPVDDGLAARLAAAADAGFTVAKIKLATRPPAAEWPLLCAQLDRAPRGLALRFDVNGAWDESSAMHWLPQLARWPTECVEDPLPDADPQALARLQTACPFPLALDATVARTDPRDPLPARRQVLKPMVLGGPRRTLEHAARPGMACVVTSTLETAVGLWHAAHLAAAVAARSGAALAHGLDTAHWLARTLGPVPPRNGRWVLPDAPGLGVEPELP